MLDFLDLDVKYSSGMTIIKPKYITYDIHDIMIRGGAFYAIYDESTKLWTKSQKQALKIIDKNLDILVKERFKNINKNDIIVLHLKDAGNKTIDDFRKYCEKQSFDSYVELDDNVIFADRELTREDYASIKLNYVLEDKETPAYDELVNTLYDPVERSKFEWAIGSIINGDSKKIQKFVIFVGDAGTGKSTILKIVRMLFSNNDEEKYYGVLDAKSLGAANAQFSLEPLRNNPLLAIQDDVELNRIEDNTRLNSLISHEPLVMNEKRKSQYEIKFRTFLFLGSNKEVKITDARSGLLRRIIDISPTSKRVKGNRYFELMDAIRFELGGIAYKCLKFYENNKNLYNAYFPVRMIRATNHIYNFIEENWVDILNGGDSVSLKDAWNRYKVYCDMSAVQYPYSLQNFKNELKNYFKEYIPDGRDEEGNHVRSRFVGFKFNKIGMYDEKETNVEEKSWLQFDNNGDNLFDIIAAEFEAQYAGPNGTPSKAWANVTTKLSNIKTNYLHYLKVPENYLMVDFDKKDPETGEKSFELNYEAAKKWPETYAELSKSGAGIHLIYIYNGNPDDVAKLYEPDVELKFFKGGASMRRKLTKYCNLPIATINSGLPKREEVNKKMVDEFVLKNEKAIRTMIEKNLRKEYHPGTKPSVDYIYKILEDAYKNDIVYDVTDLRPKILAFATNSSNHPDYCVDLVSKMHFMSDIDISNDEHVERTKNYDNADIAFYDVEVFPNLFVVVYKKAGDENKCKVLINPGPNDISNIVKMRLIGFNCRRYDNHILYARMQGYSNEELFDLSQKIVSGESKNCMFSNAYNLSYTDVYDFSSAGNKKSLKKWEIELGITHLENNLPWDQPVPEDMWKKVGEYCCNDVISTEAVFNHLQSDWIARQILADLSGLTVNDTTNQHTTKIIFGQNKHPQTVFMYRDLSKPVKWLPQDMLDFLNERFPEMMSWWKENTGSLLPYFPGYKYDHGKSVYKGIEVGEGGYVEAEPGMYGYTGLLDVASMHPHSLMTEYLFGPYTRNFSDLVDGRIIIKHEDWEFLNDILNGKLTQYVQKVMDGEITSKQLANALKTAINSVYGLTAATFENPFRDNRNVDNIVAKRGALFMVDLAEAVKKKGYRVAHIKTDSIKIPDINDDIAQFVMDFGKRYGYTFEWEATYDKMCLVNDAVYIARYRNEDGSVGEWTATGAQFAEPYVFKSLFSHEDLTLDDYCQTKSVSTSLYLDYNEDLPKDEHNYVFVGKVGSFLPIVAGAGGAELVRESKGKFTSATGAKGYRWLEAETVKNLDKQDDIDISYYVKLADAAVAKCEEYGSFEWLVDPAPYNCTVPYDTKPLDIYDPDDECPFEEMKGE